MSTSFVNEALSSISISERAAQFPDRICLASENENITSFEFNELVNSFAETLSHVPKAATFMPILLGPNINSVIAYQAAIRSRTPFALIDSNTNPEYLKSILIRLKNPRFLVNTNSEKLDLPDIEQIFLTREKNSNFTVPKAELTDSASVLFTSGSTGEPKGVVWDWNAFDLLLEKNKKFFGQTGDSIKMGRFTSLAFTAGAWQAMSPALGHEVYIIDPGNPADKIIDFVNKKQITHLALGISFGERLFDTKSDSLAFQHVNEISVYGESVNWHQIQKFRELANNKAGITTWYGASEVPGAFISRKILASDSPGVGKIPIGVLNELPHLELLPLDDGSDLAEIVLNFGVAKGYFENSELTKQKFQKQEDGSFKYLTGDLARSNKDGLISFAGRRDDLVKINGRLVEPSESEAVLRLIPGIQTLAVIPHINANGKSTLVAHIVLEPGSSLTPSEIFTELLDKLSSHLVPTKLVKHEKIPLTENGKINRQYLLNNTWPRWKDIERSKELSIFEKFALKQLQKVLDKPDLSLTEDLFGAGMDSLAAVEFDASASAFGYAKINPSIFLTHRTAEAVGTFLAQGGVEKENNVIELNKHGLNSPFFIFPGAGVTAIYFDELSRVMGQNQPLVIMEPKGLHSKQGIEMSIEEMALSASEYIHKTYPAGDVHIIGHSAGSWIGCVAGMNLNDKGRKVKLMSLDAIGYANQISMTKNKYIVVSSIGRIKDILTRNPESLKRTLKRRIKASKKSPYEFFLLHIGGLTLKHKLKEKPKFKSHILYCKENQRFTDWQKNNLLSYEKIEGNHFTLLNSEHLPNLVPKIIRFFESSQ
jgi:acyl-coenzyme A synthetase/AMP-(fatty) acid ligase/thioesterase domain-containing protein